MTCCGAKRRQWHRMTEHEAPENSILEKRFVVPDTVMFEYSGATQMLVKGPMTGRIYRFGHTGVRVAIDRQDAPSVTAVPNLKRL